MFLPGMLVGVDQGVSPCRADRGAVVNVGFVIASIAAADYFFSNRDSPQSSPEGRGN